MRSGRALRVEVRARAVDEGTLELRVRDDGRGLTPGGPLREGVGLSNTKARLSQLYGGGQTFTLVAAPQGGVEVIVTLPRGARRAASGTPHPLDPGTLVVDGGPQ